MGQTENRIKALRAAALSATIQAASATENADNHKRMGAALLEAEGLARGLKKYAHAEGYQAAAKERAKREELARDRAAGLMDRANVLEVMALELEGYAQREDPATAATILAEYMGHGMGHDKPQA